MHDIITLFIRANSHSVQTLLGSVGGLAPVLIVLSDWGQSWELGILLLHHLGTLYGARWPERLVCFED